MRTAILVPRREDYGRRDMVWGRLKRWVHEQFPDYLLIEGYDTGNAVFSMATARNNAARAAGDWDVAVVMDSDTIPEPQGLRDAVDLAHGSMQAVVAGDLRFALDRQASDSMLINEPWFPWPVGKRDSTYIGLLGGFPVSVGLNRAVGGYLDSVQLEPTSGVVVVSRPLWEATGGYLESIQGWGHEDIIFLKCTRFFGNGYTWIPNSALLHFWHPRTPKTHHTADNWEIWKNLDWISQTTKPTEIAREYLSWLGHKWTATS